MTPARTSPVTLLVAPDIATAHVVRATLEVEGIACDIPDQHMASLGWHLGNVIAGIRVQVDQVDLERAKELLATLENLPAPDDPDDAAEARSVAADRVAMRAWRLAILGLGMWPLFHPFALALALRALKAPGLIGRRPQASAVGRTHQRRGPGCLRWRDSPPLSPCSARTSST